MTTARMSQYVGFQTFNLIGEARFTGNRLASGVPNQKPFPEVEVAGVTGRWSNAKFLPKIGERVKLTAQGFTFATVVAYFMEAGFIGVEVVPETVPDWFTRQHQDPYRGDGRTNALMFGIDLLPVE